MTTLYGGLEGGGTKFNCIVAGGPDDIRAERRIRTTTPAETLALALDFFREFPIAALGIGCYGPMDLHPQSPTYGRLFAVSKPHWSHADLLGPFRALGVPLGLETDVGIAALAETHWGAAQGCTDMVYLTVGTGIGGASIVDGKLLHGRMHPEMGHIHISREPGDDFPGCCPFHGGCLQGLASGKAIHERWNTRADQLSPGHPGLELEATYLARALLSFHYTLSPQRIVLGGGVTMDQPQLLPRVRERFQEQLAGYQPPDDDLDRFIQPAALGNRAGTLGAIHLAQRALAGRDGEVDAVNAVNPVDAVG
ncbi:MAG: ROK family protein [Victivallales bacterium]|nr:ROK family protein [Victivallales bacterium]MBT7299221.1 ROK family protein [Victivallales bacterium]